MNIINGNKEFRKSGVEVGCIVVGQRVNARDETRYFYVSQEQYVEYEYLFVNLEDGIVYDKVSNIDLSIGDLIREYLIVDIFYPNEIELKLKIR